MSRRPHAAAVALAGLALASPVLAGPASAQPRYGPPPGAGVTVTINGRPVTFTPPPIERAGRVFVPLRGVFEQLGASVVYEQGTINATEIDRTVSLRLGATDATVNGVPQQLDAPPFLIGPTTYVPLRFVSQALGTIVNYDPQAHVVSLQTLGAQANANAAAAAGAPPPEQAPPPRGRPDSRDAYPPSRDPGASNDQGGGQRNFVALTSPADEQTVGNIFLVAGRTAVQARVHISVGTYSADTVADSTGYFSQQVTLAAGGGGRLNVNVTSTDPYSGATAQTSLSIREQ